MTVWVNGSPTREGWPLDRGLNYGDGVFETLAVRAGRAVHWRRHLARLRWGLRRLRIEFDAVDALQTEVSALSRGRNSAVIKVLVTRGVGKRGYAAAKSGAPTRIVSRYAMPEIAPSWYQEGVRIRWCETQLGLNPKLAGIKHLNRLEQVLARSEWCDLEIAEGLMRDCDGRVISGTSTNLFVMRNGQLVTPRVDRCGVAGVMRAVIMAQVKVWNIPVQIVDLFPQDIEAADALFLCNSVIGIWPVACLMNANDAQRTYPAAPLTRRLMQALREAA